MDRRDFLQQCQQGGAAACAAGSLGLAAWPDWSRAGVLRQTAYARALLVNEQGDPIRAKQLKARTNYVFHYPFEATPAFLLDLAQPVPPQTLATSRKDSYEWPGGVGGQRSVVAFSAICAHQLVYPTPQVSFISYRPDRAAQGQADGLIHCCADHSQYDPAKGASVVAGPANQPLCAVLLQHDAAQDTLTAYATLGGELFDAFFKKYEAKLSLDVGPRARQAVTGRSTVRELTAFCRNTIRC
jgi:arsenite oxidase small subunit